GLEYDPNPIITLPVTVRINDNPPVSESRQKERFSNVVPLIHLQQERLVKDANQVKDANHSEQEKKIEAFLRRLLISVLPNNLISETWRVMVQFETSKGPLLLKMPLYDDNIQKMIKSCL